jgi:hypothetical protein
MSTSPNQDPRLTQAAASDASLLSAHEKAVGTQADERGRYSLMPLVLLFGFSGLIFWAGTYLNRYSGQFDPKIFDENALVSMNHSIEYEIYPEWRHRYPKDITINTEHWFRMTLEDRVPVRLAPREHISYRWESIEHAASMCFSPSNQEAIRKLNLI